MSDDICEHNNNELEKYKKDIDYRIAHNMDINCFIDDYKTTYLMKICYYWDFEYVKKLVKAGANVNAEYFEGKGIVPLIWLFRYDDLPSTKKVQKFPIDIAEYLIANGADVNCKYELEVSKLCQQ